MAADELIELLGEQNEPQHLVTELAALGWQADVHTAGWRFFYATAKRGNWRPLVDL